MYILIHLGCVTVALVFNDVDPLSSRIDCRSNMPMLSHGFSPKETKESVHPFAEQGYAQRLQRATGTQATANRLTTEQAVRMIQRAFAPLRSEAEIWNDGQKLRFHVFGPDGSSLLKADEITRAQFQDHTNLSSVIEIARDTIMRNGFTMPSWSAPRADRPQSSIKALLNAPFSIRRSLQASTLTSDGAAMATAKKTHRRPMESAVSRKTREPYPRTVSEGKLGNTVNFCKYIQQRMRIARP